MYKNSSNPIAEAIPPYHACVSIVYLSIEPHPRSPQAVHHRQDPDDLDGRDSVNTLSGAPTGISA